MPYIPKPAPPYAKMTRLLRGYGSAVHVFINDLVRGGDITDDDRRTLLMEWASGEWNG